MNSKITAICAVFFLCSTLAAQDSGVITMDQEPHHHLALKNDYVKVFNVEVSPGDSIVLHRHDQDTIAIAIGEQLVTVGIPGKPDIHQKNADAQVRLQASGYIHSTHVDGATPYHTVAVELLRPQTNFHNVCANILAGQPLNCAPIPASSNRVLLASDQTEVRMVQVLAGQSANLAARAPAELIVALDAATISSASAREPERKLKPGDFLWLDSDQGSMHKVRNSNDKDARFIQIRFPKAP